MEDESTKHTKKRDALLECSMVPLEPKGSWMMGDIYKNVAQHHNNVTQVVKELNMVVEGFRQITKAKFDVVGQSIDRLEKREIEKPSNHKISDYECCTNTHALVRELKKTVHQLGTESRTQRNDIIELKTNMDVHRNEIEKLKEEITVKGLYSNQDMIDRAGKTIIVRQNLATETCCSSAVKRIKNLEDAVKVLCKQIDELEKMKSCC